MYFTTAQVVKSITELKVVHPFHGITYLACKINSMPVGKAVNFPIDAKTDEFLHEHHLIDPTSNWFFQPFYSSRNWVRPDYSAKGLQAINTQTFARAFIHEPNTRIWGWNENYIEVLKSKLVIKKRKIYKLPAFALAVWLYRDEKWPDDVTARIVLEKFTKEYDLTKEELRTLFDTTIPTQEFADKIFQIDKPNWIELRQQLPAAPDSKPDEGGTLAYLETHGLGPAKTFNLEPATRLNLITGDNGLGKSFLLEISWWALTGTWAGRPLYPNPSERGRHIDVTFAIEGEQSKGQKRTVAFDWKNLLWPELKKRPTIPGLIVYARVDGSFAIWDPARQKMAMTDRTRSAKLIFSGAEAWNGLSGQIEGLIRDWVRWQNNGGPEFQTFCQVLSKLSPPDLGDLIPGKPVRVPDDPREIPTLRHPYGEIPILYASAGVKRIVTLTYLIVWAWHEHRVASEMAQSKPQRRLVILVDEIEAHLHPRWQRSVLPALMDVAGLLSKSIKVQYFVATHSPLIMASSESLFSADDDKLFHLNMGSKGQVTLREVDFVRFGDISSWLTSPVFELRQARSSEAEKAIEDAKSLQLRKDVSKNDVQIVSEKLKLYLPPDDRFWPRWIAYAERHGVEL